MRFFLTILFLTLLNANSFSQRHVAEDEMLMVEIIKKYEKEKVKKVYKRKDGFVVLIFPNTKYVTDDSYIQNVYIKQNGKWVDLTKIKQENGKH
jgi:hypothetical protein